MPYKNKQDLKDAQRAWFQRLKQTPKYQQILKRNRKWRKNNKEIVSAYNKAWAAEHKEQRLYSGLIYRRSEKGKAKIKAYNKTPKRKEGRRISKAKSRYGEFYEVADILVKLKRVLKGDANGTKQLQSKTNDMGHSQAS